MSMLCYEVFHRYIMIAAISINGDVSELEEYAFEGVRGVPASIKQGVAARIKCTASGLLGRGMLTQLLTLALRPEITD